MRVSIGQLAIELELDEGCAAQAHLDKGEERGVRQRPLVALLELAEETEIVDDLGDIDKKHRLLPAWAIKSINGIDFKVQIF